MREIRKVETISEILEIASLANKIWHQHFTSILSDEQIDYMVDKFQSEKAMTGQIFEDHYEYYAIVSDGIPVGYTCIKDLDGDNMFLSKLYLLKEHRGKGLARFAFNKIIEIASSKMMKKITLTVNRFNETTIAIYKKMGFEITDTQVKDIGNGYVMDDYIMTYII